MQISKYRDFIDQNVEFVEQKSNQFVQIRRRFNIEKVQQNFLMHKHQHDRIIRHFQFNFKFCDHFIFASICFHFIDLTQININMI